jgi:hypothetical protein
LLSLATIAFIGSLVAPEAAHAQARARPVVRVAAAPRVGGVVVGAYYRPLFLSPFFYDPFFDPWWYPYPFGFYPPYAYGPAYYAPTASLRVQVSPRDTEVFVDGYYAGLVDNFDGMFQGLRLEPGEHDVTLYREGFRSVTQKIFLQDRGTFRIRHTMEPLLPGDTAPQRPVGPPRATAQPQPQQRPAPAPGRTAPPPDTVVRGDASFGAIAIRVQPADAEVSIDGEKWEGPHDDEALVVQIAPGIHRVDVRKDGYRAYTAEVTVTAAQTSPLNISLPRASEK